MIYVMNERMYWHYINGLDHIKPMTHEEIIAYLNRDRGLRGKITRLEIVQHA